MSPRDDAPPPWDAPPWEADDVPYDPEEGPVLRLVEPGDAVTPQPDRPEGLVLSMLDRQRRNLPDGTVVDGAPLPSMANLRRILTHDSRWSERWGYDTHQALQIWVDPRGTVRPVIDNDITHVHMWVSSVYGLQMGYQDVGRVMDYCCREAPIHPLRDWLAGLKWDGVSRLCHLWTKYFGCREHELAAKYGERWAIQAVARVFAPGCDAQGMVVLVGAQGRGKTRGVHALAGTVPDGLHDGGRRLSVDLPVGRPVTDRDSIMVMHGAWIVNADEMEALNATGIAAVKAWITQPEDRYRAPYARHPETHKRQQVLIGSTNRSTFLVDSTGSRRFWTLEIDSHTDIAAIERDRDQLWAEAVALYRAGTRWWLDDQETSLQRDLNDAHRVEGWGEHVIAALVKNAIPRQRPLFVHEVAEAVLASTGDRMDSQQAAAKARATLEHLGCTWSGSAKAWSARACQAMRFFRPPPS